MLAESHGCETVGVCNICVVGEVEEIAVRSELEFCSAAIVGFDHAREDGGVSYANDAGGANGAGLKCGRFWEVVLGEDELLC